MAEIVPFFATETEHQAVDTLPTDTVPLDDVIKAVPKFNEVAKNNLLVQWRLADGTLTYHIYKVDRKALFDKTEALMRAMATSTDIANVAAAQRVIADDANAKFETIPWWPEFEKKLMEALTEYFKLASGKVGYYREVDSWSVSLEAGPLWIEDFIKRFTYFLGYKIGEVVKWPCGSYVGVDP